MIFLSLYICHCSLMMAWDIQAEAQCVYGNKVTISKLLYLNAF